MSRRGKRLHVRLHGVARAAPRSAGDEHSPERRQHDACCRDCSDEQQRVTAKPSAEPDRGASANHH